MGTPSAGNRIHDVWSICTLEDQMLKGCLLFPVFATDKSQLILPAAPFTRWHLLCPLSSNQPHTGSKHVKPPTRRDHLVPAIKQATSIQNPFLKPHKEGKKTWVPPTHGGNGWGDPSVLKPEFLHPRGAPTQAKSLFEDNWSTRKPPERFKKHQNVKKKETTRVKNVKRRKAPKTTAKESSKLCAMSQKRVTKKTYWLKEK